MNENYILPIELAILMGFWCLPPLTIAVGLEIYIFRKIRLWQNSRSSCYVALLITVMSSLVIAFLALPFSPPRWLNVSDNMLFHPMAFVIVFGVVFTIVGYLWHGARKNT